MIHFVKKGIAAGALLLGFLPVQAQREMKTINDNWEFRKPADTQWTSVNLPHTYNLDAYAGMQYYQGKGMYRRTLILPEVKADKRYYLKIDAASKAAEVRVNGTVVANHAGGYTAFTADITPHIKTENLIEITVDNGRKDIAPISADFTFWGGIYRDVWLIETSEQHFNMENMGSDGIFISTPAVNEKEGVLQIRTEIANDADKRATLEVKNEIYSPDGTLLQTLRRTLRLDAGEISPIETVSEAIENPQLWTPETPALYRIETSLADARTGRILDRRTHRTGFRWYSFDGEKGFFLNGKPYKLRGFNRHQDQAPVGVALPDEAHRRDVAQMKELGANFIRIAHYPQDDAILDQCDELGLLAWEEIPIINIVPDTPGYADNCEQNLREMIRQHYNHTCVIAGKGVERRRPRTCKCHGIQHDQSLYRNRAEPDRRSGLEPIPRLVCRQAGRIQCLVRRPAPTLSRQADDYFRMGSWKRQKVTYIKRKSVRFQHRIPADLHRTLLALYRANSVDKRMHLLELHRL